jgi:cell division protease FtsH
VDNPDAKGREEILKVHTKGKPLARDVDLTYLARSTPGFSGADIANMVNEAALLAARRDKKQIGIEEFQESIERVVAGPERRSRIISDKEKRILAYHEAGHALVSKLLPNADPVRKVTILPRGMALGYTMQVPVEDHYITSKSELIDNMTILLGGRAAEEIVFNESTTGAENDLERVTEIARRMVCEYGMSDTLGPVTLGRRHGPIFLGREIAEDRNYSEEVASAIDKEVRRLIDDCFQRARELLTARRATLDALVEVLLQKETIDGEELDRIVNNSALASALAPGASDGENDGSADSSSATEQSKTDEVTPAPDSLAAATG